MPREKFLFTFDYDDLTEITGLGKNAIYQHVARGELNPHDLRSLVLWLSRHAEREFRIQMMAEALEFREPKGRTKKKKKPSSQ